MKEGKKSKIVCHIDKLLEKSTNTFKPKIKDDYHVNMYDDRILIMWFIKLFKFHS
jgi:hypothetical protein